MSAPFAGPVPRRALLGAGAALAAAPARAQPWRPARSVTLLVPFAAGSGTDAISRILAQLLEPEWGQPVVVENRAGANGALAAAAAARAAPDGLTLFMTTNTPHAANPALMKRLDYDPLADFAALSRTGNYNFWLVVPEASPFRSVADIIAAAKARPGAVTYASGNSTGIVAGGTIAAMAGVEMTHVPYRSTPPAITDVVAGRVSCMVVDASSSLGVVRAGQLRVLGVTTRQRSKLLPDVPALHEVGLPGFDVAAWAGLVGPARMPPAMVASINADVRRVWDRPETVRRLGEIGFDGFSSPAEEFAEFIRTEIDKWGRMARAAGIEPE
ncbi:Bug family tripartite tricarboxylate transporter substrate binding protein [Paracraurococcus ruber]|uniref:ABC transporter substrate-binding protein n=1 Tax=Paracraurococcus ruber TaxID=77675 RepID=A0ABS1CVA0_9PROT|nr:tripartite tricarboxylate transporter substrate-binding protein [Paracraurococcus ruber]MBK1658330.1 ABC transporter substrate-binding protein [Paracraurococcus ruber]TDG29923.1 tripartite tricarboxylate transporter substrate binding protein [Paracraurococcus ruber]